MQHAGRQANQQLHHQLLQLVERQGAKIWRRQYGHDVRQPCQPSSREALTSARHTRRPGKLTKSSQIKISMDGKGRCMDNVFVERLWRSLKYEEVYLHAY